MIDIEYAPNEARMYALLDLINSEWVDYPRSTQYFDTNLIKATRDLLLHEKRLMDITLTSPAFKDISPYNLKEPIYQWKF